MKPEYFLSVVVGRNIDLLREKPGRLATAVNILLTLDAFVGILHAALVAAGVSVPDKDDEFRDVLAAQNEDYRIVRDAAFAIKHGQLTGRKSRIVTNSKQMAIYGAVFEEAVFQDGVFEMGAARIEVDSTSVDVVEVAERRITFLYEILEQTSGGQRQ
ncbi:hypothetical protein I6F33_26105 [Bradyrhizobium sp. BRP20]|uniref:hypothetical protein n=1 Tax=Bradyrhizobium sp. BRP20 TaxID=2793822 RepID=UPI001CD22D7B|nr:hypothetical protein [Bradyrhizobium sp. BRP20]MCA1436423.1 hypothetical protein [Bradyrhizobium sp. BRP20]